jgi:hypothetical protein
MNGQIELPANTIVVYTHRPFLVRPLSHIAIGSARIATGARAAIHLLSLLLVEWAIVSSKCRVWKLVCIHWVANLGQFKVVSIRHVDLDSLESADMRNLAV